MASAARTLTRTIFRAKPSGPSLRLTAGNSFTRSSRRGYASGPESSRSYRNLFLGAGGIAAAGAAGFYFYNQKDIHLVKGSAGETTGLFKPTKNDYQKVYDHIASLLVEKDEYDDGSYGPVLVRLAWHASGTYDAATGTGGSNGATMRFGPEGDHGANAGLKHARDFLEPVKRESISAGYWSQVLITCQKSSPGSPTPISGPWVASAPSKKCKVPSSHGDLAVKTEMWPSVPLMADCQMPPKTKTTSGQSLGAWDLMTVKWSPSLELTLWDAATQIDLASTDHGVSALPS